MAFIYNLLDTWNNAGTVFSGIKLNVTNTASAAGSKLIDLQIGGSTFFNVDKSGQVELLAGTAAAPTLIPTGDTNTGMWFPAADTVAWSTGGSERMRIASSGAVTISEQTSLAGRAVFSTNGSVDISGTISQLPQITLTNAINDALSVAWNTIKSRGGTTAANAGDQIGMFRFTSYTTGGVPSQCAQFLVNSAGASAGGHAANFLFSTRNTSDVFAERMRITSAGNVGIGTSSPTTLLSVNGIASFGAGAAATPSIAAFGDTNTGMWFPAADTVAWSTNGTEKMRLDTNGFLGIGTSSPSVQLDIRSANAFSPQLLVVNSTVDAFGPYWNTRKLRGSAAANSGDDLGTFMFQSADTGGTLRNAVWIVAKSQGAGAAYHSGYFDVNVTSPAGAFVNSFQISSDGARVGPAGAVALPSVSQISDPDTGMWWPAANTLAWSTVGSERLRLTSAGNLGLGTSTFGTSAATVFAIATGIAPTTGPADTIQIYSTDLSAGNTMLSLYTEGTIVNANTTAATTHRIAIRVNGTVYYLLANTAA